MMVCHILVRTRLKLVRNRKQQIADSKWCLSALRRIAETLLFAICYLLLRTSFRRVRLLTAFPTDPIVETCRIRSSTGQSVGLRSQRLWVRAPPDASPCTPRKSLRISNLCHVPNTVQKGTKRYKRYQ